VITDTAATPRSRRRLSSRQKTWIVVGVIALGFLLPLPGLLRSQGPPMEEGFMLVFPERFLHGDFPNRDFLHLYGPGSVWFLAGVFKVFGVSLTAERLVALLQQVGVVAGVYVLARFWGRRVALACALVSLVITIPPIHLTALAWVGAVALALLGLALAVESLRSTDERRAWRFALGGGVLFGLALLYRLDLVLAVGLAGVMLVRWLPARNRRALLGGFAIGLSPYLVHLATAGIGNTIRGMILDPVIYLRGGRRLPVPPPWDHLDGFLQKVGAIDRLSWPVPSLTTAQQLFVWFFFLLGSVAFLVVVGIWCYRREPATIRSRTLLAVALLSVGLLPQAVQRVDSAHFAWVSCVPVAFLPVALFEVLRRRAPRLSPGRRSLVAGGAVALFVVLVIPFFTARTYVEYSLESFGIDRVAHKIEHEGRVFYYGRKDAADAANEMLPVADRISRDGDRLFVGPTDLRKTPYSDAYLYYMLPDLDPATYFIEMDPGVANREGSRMTDDLRSADIAILSAVWNDWDEPNDARKFGPDEPNRVIDREFCLVGKYGEDDLYELYEKCDRSDGSRSGVR
jgi:hypothetical protein